MINFMVSIPPTVYGPWLEGNVRTERMTSGFVLGWHQILTKLLGLLIFMIELFVCHIFLCVFLLITYNLWLLNLLSLTDLFICKSLIIPQIFIILPFQFTSFQTLTTFSHSTQPDEIHSTVKVTGKIVIQTPWLNSNILGIVCMFPDILSQAFQFSCLSSQPILLPDTTVLDFLLPSQSLGKKLGQRRTYSTQKR